MSLNWTISLKDRGKHKKKYLKPTVVKPGQSWQGETAYSRTAYSSVRWFFRIGATLFGRKELEIKTPLQFGWFIVLNGGKIG